MGSNDHRVTGLEAAWERGGRPSLYDPRFCDLVRRLALLGMPCTMHDLALFFGVVRSTIYLWKSQFPEFSDAIEAGRLRADGLVAEKLFQRAIGYEWVEQQALKVKRVEYHENGEKALETEEIRVVDVRRESYRLTLPPRSTGSTTGTPIFGRKSRSSLSSRISMCRRRTNPARWPRSTRSGSPIGAISTSQRVRLRTPRYNSPHRLRWAANPSQRTPFRGRGAAPLYLGAIHGPSFPPPVSMETGRRRLPVGNWVCA